METRPQSISINNPKSTTTIYTNELLVTPEMAMNILQTNIRNRQMNKNLVLFYAMQMTEGKWKFNGESIIISDGNVLLDGQHRLAAIVKSKTAQRMIIVRGIDANTFDTIDVGKIRTAGDIFSIENIKNANGIAGVISTFLNYKSGVISALTNNYGGIKITAGLKTTKQDVLLEYKKDPDFWQEIFAKSIRLRNKLKLIETKTIGAYSAFLILDKQHSGAKVFDFFEQLFFDTNIENPTIPVLREKLLKSILGQYKISPQLRHAVIVKTWNAYVTGKELKRLSFDFEKETMPTFI